MKRLCTALLIFLSLSASARNDTASRTFTHAVFERHSTQVSLSLGFIDGYRNELKMPRGFEKTNTTGYCNAILKVDYGLTKNISLAASFGYDRFVYNFAKLDTGAYGGIIRRYNTNNVRVISAGLMAYYHLGNVIKVKRLDPFVGLGASLNNVRYGAYPQGDSTVVHMERTITPYLKVGARYYLSDRFSIFADAGLEKQAIIGLGFSCRFFPKPVEKK